MLRPFITLHISHTNQWMSSDFTGKTVPTGRHVIYSKNHSIDTMLYRSLSSFCCRPGAGFRTTTGVHLHTGFKNVASLWPVCCPRPLETEAGEDGVPGNPLTASVLHKHVQLCRFSHGKKIITRRYWKIQSVSELGRFSLFAVKLIISTRSPGSICAAIREREMLYSAPLISNGRGG